MPVFVACVTAVVVTTVILHFLKNLRHAREFEGKRVLITGGSRGLGLLLAEEFLKEGAKVAVCARDARELERAAARLDVATFVCDLRKPPQVDELIANVRKRLGGIDVLVNNAGVIQVGPFEEMTLEDYREAMDVHYWAPLRTILAVLPEMRSRKNGHIVNITSIGGKISAPHLLPYNASKFALVGLSEGLRTELSKDNVKVTTVRPGLMRTGSPVNAYFKGRNDAEYAWFSISDSLPFLSINASRAARQILAAAKRGDAEITLTMPAKIGVRVHGIFPGLMSGVLAWVNRLMPKPGGIGRRRAKGSQSFSKLSPSRLTALNDKAALQNNEWPGTPVKRRF